MGFAQSVFYNNWVNDGDYPGMRNTEDGRDIVELGPDRFLGIYKISVRVNSYWDSVQVVEFSNGQAPRSIFARNDGIVFKVVGELSTDSNFVYLGVNTSDVGVPFFNVLKVSLDSGELVWKKRITGPDWAKVTDLLVLPNGNLVFCGEALHYSEDPERKWLVGCFSPSGRLLWRKEWGGPYTDQATCLALGINGEILVGGHFSYEEGPYKFDPSFQALDFEGNELWRTRIDHLSRHGGVGSFAVNSKGEIYALMKTADAEVAKFSPDFDLIWRIPTHYQATIDLDPNENVCVGFSRTNGISIGTNLKKYSPEGDLILDNSAHWPTSLQVRYMKMASDGGAAFIGNTGGDGFFAKVNCQGEFLANVGICSAAPAYDYPDVVNYLLYEEQLTAPMLGLEEGQSAAIEVYNLMGQRVATWLGESDRHSGIDLTSLQESWYLYRLRSGESVVKTGRLQLVK